MSTDITFSTENKIFENDDISFIAEIYGETIRNYLNDTDLGITFFAESELYADEIISSEKSFINLDNMRFSFIQDFSLEQSHILTDINYCKVGEHKFVKIITPFTRSRSYDFIIAKREEIKNVARKLTENRNKSFVKRMPPHIIGLPIEEIEKKTIDFLLDEDLRSFCKERDIPLKRGVVFEGPPGTGKSMTLKYLRTKADNHDIEFEIFSNIKEFIDNSDDYFRDEKKIFVFEDFDTALIDRDNTGGTPNEVLGKILNTLDGIREIDNVVSIFTTNKINLFDDAFIRPGRIDTVFNFKLPSEESIKEFIEKYLFDFDTDFIYKIVMDIRSSANISYAYLKGISDDLNIHKFFKGENPSNEEIERIIRERAIQANKGNDKKASEFVL